MKDNFSTASDQYAQYRPTYPAALFDYLNSIVAAKEAAWDCATGNGQVARQLAPFFRQVFATDISAAQLAHAAALPNIQYSVQPAESTQFDNNVFDLITVGQAVHWFSFAGFYGEVKRTARNNALLVIMGYGKLAISPQLDAIVEHLYSNIIGAYWDAERRYVDEGYKTIPFPFAEISAPEFRNSYAWTFAHLIGYLKTWSAVKHYEQQHGVDPVSLIENDLQKHWGMEEKQEVHFPLLLRIGRVKY